MSRWEDDELSEIETAVRRCRGLIQRRRAESELLEQRGHDATQARELMRTCDRLLGEHEFHGWWPTFAGQAQRARCVPIS